MQDGFWKWKKISKYFCSLEKRHYTSKQMTKITKIDGNTSTDLNTILQEVNSFYANLYSEKPVDKLDFNLINKNIPKLTDNDKNSLEGEITLEEASIALKNMKNNKSPGSDGFSAEFFKVFWKSLGWFVVRSLNEGYRKEELSITQREGVIICIPKPDKPRNFIKKLETDLSAKYCLQNRFFIDRK